MSSAAGPGHDGMTLENASLAGTTAIVTGASRGFGHAIAAALVEAGARVVGVARSVQPGYTGFTPVVADATDEAVAAELVRLHQPKLLVLNAGATPAMGPVSKLTWDEFGRNWQTDTRHAFVWTREALTAPLPPGSTVVIVSSGAALRGSPMSGGYAGAKAAIRFLSSYAAGEASEAGLGIRFVTLLPQLTPATGLGTVGVAAYAARAGTDVATFTASIQPILTPEGMAEAVVGLALGPSTEVHTEYLVTGAGLQPV
jgi:NAD(P)-dependent dehydrogenase (short-subunit alcohol dehydrogenase family)